MTPQGRAEEKYIMKNDRQLNVKSFAKNPVKADHVNGYCRYSFFIVHCVTTLLVGTLSCDFHPKQLFYLCAQVISTFFFRVSSFPCFLVWNWLRLRFNGVLR